MFDSRISLPTGIYISCCSNLYLLGLFSMVQIFELTKALKLSKYSQIIKYPLETLKVEQTFYKFVAKGGFTLTTDVLVSSMFV